jgi:peroxiredoxin
VRSFKDQFDARGVGIAIVSFAEPAKLRRYQQEHQWPFTMLADPTRAVYEAFDLKRFSWLQVFPFATLKLYLNLLRQGLRRENWGDDDIYQGGGDFLIDRSGNIRLAWRSRDPADRPSAQRLLQEIDRGIRAS